MGDETMSREAELERRIAELERRLAAGERGSDGGTSGPEAAFWALMHRIFPEEARRHMKVATREQLLTARTYLDRWIERLDEAPAEERRHETIDVE